MFFVHSEHVAPNAGHKNLRPRLGMGRCVLAGDLWQVGFGW